METGNIPNKNPDLITIPVGQAYNIWGGLDNDRARELYIAMSQIKQNFDELIGGNATYTISKIYETNDLSPITEGITELTVDEYSMDNELKVLYEGLIMIKDVDYIPLSSTQISFPYGLSPDFHLVIYEYPEHIKNTELLVSPMNVRSAPQTNFITSSFSSSDVIEVFVNGVLMKLTEDYTILSTNHIQFTFEVDIEDSVYVYRQENLTV